MLESAADELIAATELGLAEDAAGVVELGCGAVAPPPPPPPHPHRESNRPDNSSLFARVMAILFIVVSHRWLREQLGKFERESFANDGWQVLMLALKRVSIGK